MPLWFDALIALMSFVAGATASIVGIGIGGSLWHRPRRSGNRFAASFRRAPARMATPPLSRWAVLVRFGILSAIGGLIGALVFAYLEPTALGRVLGALLVLTATAGVTGWSERWRPIGPLVWVLGALSGFFGGVVGNQGGLRAASLSAFGLKPTVFVATSTVIG